MAKSKKSSVRSSVRGKGKTRGDAQLPEGFKALDERAPNWDHVKMPVLSGVRSDTREIVFDKGTKKERVQQVFNVTTASDETFAVWESAALRTLFEKSEEGDEVYIKYMGLGKAKKGESPPKLFKSAIKAA